jgi:hypothetical protein
LALTPPVSTNAPALLTVNGYVAAPPFSEYPNFHVPVGVAAVAGNTSAKKSTVSDAEVSHAVPRHFSRGLICTVVPAVAAVVFWSVRPSVDVVPSPVTVCACPPAFEIENLLTPPTCKSISNDAVALFVSVMFSLIPVNVVPIAVHVCRRSSTGEETVRGKVSYTCHGAAQREIPLMVTQFCADAGQATSVSAQTNRKRRTTPPLRSSW